MHLFKVKLTGLSQDPTGSNKILKKILLNLQKSKSMILISEAVHMLAVASSLCWCLLVFLPSELWLE